MAYPLEKLWIITKFPRSLKTYLKLLRFSGIILDVIDVRRGNTGAARISDDGFANSDKDGVIYG